LDISRIGDDFESCGGANNKATFRLNNLCV